MEKKTESFSSKIKRNTGCPLLTFLFYIVLIAPSQRNQAREKNKKHINQKIRSKITP